MAQTAAIWLFNRLVVNIAAVVDTQTYTYIITAKN